MKPGIGWTIGIGRIFGCGTNAASAFRWGNARDRVAAVLMWIGLISLAGCGHSEGPVCTPEQVFLTPSPQGMRLTLVLAASWWREKWPFDDMVADGRRTFVVDCAVPNLDGALSLSTAGHVLDQRPAGHYPSYFPVRGSTTWTRVDVSGTFPQNLVEVARLRPRAKADANSTGHPLVKLQDAAAGPLGEVYVVSPSGADLLTVTTAGAARYDLRSGAPLPSEAPAVLADLRRAFVERRGHPGHWAGSQNLEYVVAVPPENVHRIDGGVYSMSKDPGEHMSATVAGVTRDLPWQAALYAAATNSVVAVPAALEFVPSTTGVAARSRSSGDGLGMRIRLSNLRSAPEGPLLLYGAPWDRNDTMVIADTTGRPLFQIAAPPTSRAFDWWPETDQMVFLTTDDDWPQGRSRTGERATRYSVVVVNYRTGRRVTATFDSRDIRALVTAATPQGELRRP